MVQQVGMKWFKLFRKKKKNISFKEAIDLTGFPIITFESKNKKFNFLLDTGSNCSVLNDEYAKEIEGDYTGQVTYLCGLDGIDREVKFFKANMLYGDKNLTEEFQITDLSGPFNSIKKEFGVTLHGILGNSFFTKYQSLIDFNNLKFQI